MRDGYIGRKTFSTCAMSALAPLTTKPPSQTTTNLAKEEEMDTDRNADMSQDRKVDMSQDKKIFLRI